jgi:FK506-binding protein 1
VVIEYEARLENGAIADRSSAHQKDGEPFSFVVGLGNVIDGWDIGVMNMQLGERCDIFITSKYAFGDEGRPPKIPPKAPVIFNVELIQIGDRKSQKRMRNHLGTGALVKDAEASKKLGNEAFKAKSYKEATEYYAEGLELLVIGEDKEKDET